MASEVNGGSRSVSRRSAVVWLVGLGVTLAAAVYVMRRRIVSRLSGLTRSAAFASTPPLTPHDPVRDRSTIHVARGGTPGENIDQVLAKIGGMQKVVGANDVVIVKVSAQWWNQGMTNVAAVRRTIEKILEIPGFSGEVIVFENVHFRMPDGSGLARAWTHPSDRNVDIPGWNKLGDLIPHFKALGAPVSFVGLVDAGLSALSDDHWHDHGHAHGVYGGDGRGPIAPGEDRDGYHWDFSQTFRKRRSLVDYAQVPLSWPVFTSPGSGLVVDLKDGLFKREGGKRHRIDRKLTFINMTTANEHGSTGFTGCCKSAMGIVDMSAGRLGTDPRISEYQSVHYFGSPTASWRMAGPLAHFARQVRTPDLYITVAEWVAAMPHGITEEEWGEGKDIRHAAESAVHTKTVVAGTDPVAVDAWCVRNLLMPIGGSNRDMYDLDNPDSRASRFLRYYREVYGAGTLLPELVVVT